MKRWVKAAADCYLNDVYRHAGERFELDWDEKQKLPDCLQAVSMKQSDESAVSDASVQSVQKPASIRGKRKKTAADIL